VDIRLSEEISRFELVTSDNRPLNVVIKHDTK